jgi:hypothetical protein
MAWASTLGLRIVLVLAGVFTALTGLSLMLGGMLTLAWQGPAAFFTVTNEQAYLVQDSHIRFFGGLWVAVGSLFILGAVDPLRFQGALKLVFVLILVGGLARFSQMRPDVTLGPSIAGSLAAEIVGMPILYFWLSKTVKLQQPASSPAEG